MKEYQITITLWSGPPHRALVRAENAFDAVITALLGACVVSLLQVRGITIGMLD